MATGPGYLDDNGIWQYGESDFESLASDLLNIGQQATSEQIERLDLVPAAFRATMANR